MLEVLIQNKIYISPTYFREKKYKMIYEKYNACILIESLKELEDLILRLKYDISDVPYDMNNINNFFDDVVNAGKKNNNVLGAYKDLILSYLNNNNIN